jgi:hypothetical protein
MRRRSLPPPVPDEFLAHQEAPDYRRAHHRFHLWPARHRTSALAPFRVPAEGDLDADAALASAVDYSPPRSQTPPRRPLSNQRGRAARGCGAAEIGPVATVRAVPAKLLLSCVLPSGSRLAPEPISRSGRWRRRECFIAPADGQP